MHFVLLGRDGEIAADINRTLASAGHQVDRLTDTAPLLRAARTRLIEMIVLLPGEVPERSLETVRLLKRRFNQLPPLFVVEDPVDGIGVAAALNAGADAYMATPLSQAAFLARVTALLRRHYPELAVGTRVQVGRFVLDALARRIYLDGQPINMPAREFDLAWLLFCNMERLLPRHLVEQRVWGRPMPVESRTLDTHLSRLRRRIHLTSEYGLQLVTVYGKGFRLERVARQR